MKTSVNILVTCRSKELLPAALLVFKTLRVGFPTAGVNVFGNGLEDWAVKEVYNATQQVGGTYMPVKAEGRMQNAEYKMSHGEWIEWLLEWNARGIWICDTDVVFFDEVENWFDPRGETLFAGRYEPSFNCDWTRATHVARLHPSLMFLNPQRLAWRCRAWPHEHPFFNTVERNLFRWQWVPVRDHVLEGERADNTRLLFYDTCAGLYHALGAREKAKGRMQNAETEVDRRNSGTEESGVIFSEGQNEAFEHLYCGSYLDLIKNIFPPGTEELHQAVCERPDLARGLWKRQQEWYRERRPNVQ